MKHTPAPSKRSAPRTPPGGGSRGGARGHFPWLVMGSVIAAAVVVVGLSWWLWPTTPAMPATMDEARTLVMSSQFQAMSAQEQRPYLDRIREQFGSLNHEERRAMMEEDEQLRNAMMNVFWRQMEGRARDWALASPEEREEMAGQFRGGRGGGDRPDRTERPADQPRPQRPDGAQGGPPRGGPNPNMILGHINDRMANGNPQTNTYIGEMFRSHRDRRRQRRDGN